MSEKEEIPLLHVYGQSEPHDEVWLVLNRSGLERLQAALARAGEQEFGEEDAFVSGPEGGFPLRVLLLSEPARSDLWKELAVPYRGQSWAEERRPDAIWPLQLAPTQRLPTPTVKDLK